MLVPTFRLGNASAVIGGIRNEKGFIATINLRTAAGFVFGVRQ